MVLVFTCRGALQSIEMKTQQVVSKPCAAEVAKAATLPGADPAAAEGQTAVSSGAGASPLIPDALMHGIIIGTSTEFNGGLEGFVYCLCHEGSHADSAVCQLSTLL